MKAPTMTREQAIEKIADACEGIGLMSLRDKLNPIFGNKAVDFQFEPVAYFTVKSPDGGKQIIITNVSNADGPDRVVGQIAIG